MKVRSAAVLRAHGGQRGASLIEVLVALLVFSIGLLGLAGLIIVSLRSTQGAYLRTQASVLAQSISDRMRANTAAVWSGAYNGSYPLTGSSTVDCTQTACNAAQLAAQDGQRWSQELSAALPQASASLQCDNTAAGSAPSDLSQRPPYGGNCALSISWSERALGDSSHSTAATRTFSWNFQP